MRESKQEQRKEMLLYGMVGGGPGSLIGDVHKTGIDLEGGAELKAASFSRDYEKTLITGKHYGLQTDRLYRNYQEMAEAEAQREDGIDFVVITTPNNTHYPISKAFLESGIHVVCDKPLTVTSEEGKELKRIAEEKGLRFCVTYTYTGYTMVKQARLMIQKGEIGRVRAIRGQYLQGWLATQVEKEGSKQASWRCDPNQSGIANCMGDIGTHIENMIAYVTGLEIEAVCADLTSYGDGRQLDNDGKVLVKYKGGAKGSIWVSQIAIGHENDLAFTICGEKGTIEWHQEDPDHLIVKMLGQPKQIFSRGNGNIYPEIDDIIRIPAGHVEGHYVAFANIYREFINDLAALKTGKNIVADYPGVDAGISGNVFVEKCVESDKADSIWIKY